MKFLKLLKKLPIDLGQAELKYNTKGKLIAYSLIKKGNSKKNALDIGCRDGYWTKKIKKKNYKVKSIDLEPHYKYAKKIDVDQNLPYKSNTFDLIWCSEVIEHLKDPKKSIKEMKRVTKNNGLILLTTPNSYFWLMKFIYLFGLTPSKIQNSDHKHFFNIKKLKQILPNNSKIYGFFPYFLMKMKIKKMIGTLSPTFIISIKVKK